MSPDDSKTREELLGELTSLRASHALLREAEALSETGSWQWRIPDDLAFFSSQWLRIHGLGEEGCSLEQMFELIHPEERIRIMDALQGALDGPAMFDEEYRIIRAGDLEVRMVHALGRVRRDPLGRPVEFVGTVRDVTGREARTRELKRANEFLEQLIESARTIVVCLDASGRILICNQALADVSGYRREELIGADWFETLVPAGRFPEVVESFRAGLPEEFENPILTKGGELRHIAWQNNTFPAAEGQEFLVSFGYDITDRKKVEEDLRLSREHAELLSDFLENSSQPFVAVDPRGRIALFNAAFSRMLGYSRDELPGLDSVSDLTPPEYRDMEREHLARLEAEGEPVRYEKEFTRKDGSRVPVQMSVHLKRSPDGTVGYRYAFIMDTTESNAVRERLKAALAAVEASSRAKSEFLANMSHEIRTPISAILGLAELSLRLPDPDTVRQHLGMISDSAKQLLGIIGDVLDLSRVEAGKLQLEIRPFSLDEVIQNSLAQFRNDCVQKGIALTSEVDPGVPARLAGDPVRLGQVLTNLLGNALKFTRQGSIHLKVAAMSSISPSLPMLRFSVSDTGIGIEPSQASTIFESFRQADSSYSKSYQGVGLGLAICRELSSLMGGTIWVESEPGHGSTFHFTAVFEKVEPLQAAGAGKPCGKADIAPSKILVVEDNPFNRHVFEQYLKILGHDVSVACDGREALEALRRESFDLVFMDVQMPEVDGLEAVKRIREGECGEEARRMPVVALTAYAMQGDKERFLGAGMSHYLSKPVTLEALQEAVATFASSPGRTASAAPQPRPSMEEPLRPLLKDYINFVREMATRAEHYLKAGDLAQAARIGHDIKGTSLAFGVEGINLAGAAFDQACREGEKDKAEHLLGTIQGALDALDPGRATGAFR